MSEEQEFPHKPRVWVDREHQRRQAVQVGSAYVDDAVALTSPTMGRDSTRMPGTTVSDGRVCARMTEIGGSLTVRSAASGRGTTVGVAAGLIRGRALREHPRMRAESRRGHCEFSCDDNEQGLAESCVAGVTFWVA